MFSTEYYTTLSVSMPTSSSCHAYCGLHCQSVTRCHRHLQMLQLRSVWRISQLIILLQWPPRRRRPVVILWIHGGCAVVVAVWTTCESDCQC